MLEVGRVVHAGRHHDDGGIADAGRGNRAQVFQQHVGVVLDRGNAVACEQFGEQPHHHLAVFQHVGNAGGHAQIVFEHVKLAFAGAHDVDAGDVGVDVRGDIDALHFRAVLGILVDLLGGDDAGLDDVLVVVDVVHEHVQRLHALDQAGLQGAPFVRGDDARDRIERDQALGAGIVAIHGEGDADSPERQVRFGALALDVFGRLALQPALEFAVVVPYRRPPVVLGIHLIEELGHDPIPLLRHCMCIKNCAMQMDELRTKSERRHHAAAR